MTNELATYLGEGSSRFSLFLLCFYQVEILSQTNHRVQELLPSFAGFFRLSRRFNIQGDVKMHLLPMITPFLLRGKIASGRNLWIAIPFHIPQSADVKEMTLALVAGENATLIEEEMIEIASVREIETEVPGGIAMTETRETNDANEETAEAEMMTRAMAGCITVTLPG
jgi:hypothetical protein